MKAAILIFFILTFAMTAIIAFEPQPEEYHFMTPLGQEICVSPDYELVQDVDPIEVT